MIGLARLRIWKLSLLLVSASLAYARQGALWTTSAARAVGRR